MQDPVVETRSADSVSQTLQLLIRALHTLRSYPAENDMCKRALSQLLPKLEQVVPLEIELSREGVRWSGGGDQDLGGDRSSIMEALYRDGIRRVQLLGSTVTSHFRRLRRWPSCFIRSSHTTTQCSWATS